MPETNEREQTSWVGSLGDSLEPVADLGGIAD